MENDEIVIAESDSKSKSSRSKTSADQGDDRLPARLIFMNPNQSGSMFEKTFELLKLLNEKEYGQKIEFEHLVAYFISKISNEDMDAIRELSLSVTDRAEIQLKAFNLENNTNYTLAEYSLTTFPRNNSKGTTRKRSNIQ